MSSMLAARVQQAAALWHAGKVQKVLVSGDHHTWAYDEPDTMRKALVRDGVSPVDISRIMPTSTLGRRWSELTAFSASEAR